MTNYTDNPVNQSNPPNKLINAGIDSSANQTAVSASVYYMQ